MPLWKDGRLESFMKSFGSEGILFPTYFIMLAIFIYLNFVGKSSFDWLSIAVSIGMFVIVGIIILWSTYACFFPVSKMTARLRYTVQTMEIDYNKTGTYLWETYRNETNLFDNKILNKRFNEYRIERKRLMMISGNAAKCDIEDYISEYFIDSQIKKGMVSIIPGVMTGLGILGTFLGLTFALQNFNTSSASEITKSIAPLMDGIKVAFHTSVYGMVFSLIFNYVYKKDLEEAYCAVDLFLENYHKYVLPMTKNDDISMLMEAQTKQIQDMEVMLERLSDKLATKIAQAIHESYLGEQPLPESYVEQQSHRASYTDEQPYRETDLYEEQDMLSQEELEAAGMTFIDVD